jgi:fructuronate reductase
MTTRLSAASKPAAGVEAPAYDPESCGAGIVHIGLGAFHKAHQAVYTDTALGLAGGDWRITGVSLRSADVASALNPQDGRYLLLVRDEAGDSVRLIGSIAKVLVAPAEPEAVIEAIASPETRIVSLTVTEKAYGIDRATGGVDLTHDVIAHDLQHPERPKGAVGFLVAGLKQRRASEAGPLTILCCDNLPENGRLVRRVVLDFAERVEPALAQWIARTVSFPSSMVDRITPAATPQTLQDAARLSGFEDMAAVETEPFSQWIIENDFAAGRPEWEAAGALFVEDVAPYEKMKLRLLNGTHSLLAYAGFLAGQETVSEAVRNEALRAIAERQMRASAATLPPVPGIDLDAYRAELLARFANRAIRHLTYQIAMDGTEKLPQRICAPLGETLAANGDAGAFAFAVAAWMRYCLGVTDDGHGYDLRDPRQAVIAERLDGVPRDADAIFDALSALQDVFPAELAGDPRMRGPVVEALSTMLGLGMAEAIRVHAIRHPDGT